MKSSITLSLMLLSPLLVYAAGEKTEIPHAEEKIEFQTEVDPKVYSPKEFEKKSGHKTKALKKEPLPASTRDERDLVFSKVDGLEKQITGYDHLAKDMLFYRAKSNSIKELSSLYPQIPQSILKNLQKQLAKSSKK